MQTPGHTLRFFPWGKQTGILYVSGHQLKDLQFPYVLPQDLCAHIRLPFFFNYFHLHNSHTLSPKERLTHTHLESYYWAFPQNVKKNSTEASNKRTTTTKEKKNRILKGQ